MVDKQPLSANKSTNQSDLTATLKESDIVSVLKAEKQSRPISDAIVTSRVRQGFDRHLSVLSWQKAFVDLAPSLWPNVSKICKQIGITRQLFYKSLQLHPKFANQIEAIDQEITDNVEGLTANLAMVPKHVIDRMAYLRARRPELYDRAKRVIVSGAVLSTQESRQRLAGFEQAVDAEIVKAGMDRRDRKALKQGRVEVKHGGCDGGGVSGGTDGETKV